MMLTKDREIVDYRVVFNELIDDLFDNHLYDYEGVMLSHEIRTKTCENILQDYFELHKEYPPNHMLERLSNYILKKDLQRRKGFTVQKLGKYPYLSTRQIKSRLLKEVNFTQAFNYDSKGDNVLHPTRFERIKSEIAQLYIK